MEIFHWWLIKMVAIQLLCMIGVGWGVRYLRQNRLVSVKTQNASPAPSPSARRD